MNYKDLEDWRWIVLSLDFVVVCNFILIYCIFGVEEDKVVFGILLGLFLEKFFDFNRFFGFFGFWKGKE